MANSPSPNYHSNRLVRVLYADHILYWNSDPALFGSLNIREVVGWIENETEDFVCLTFDRSLKPLPHERRECGLIISKADILEFVEIRKPY